MSWLAVDHHVHTVYAGHSDPALTVSRIVAQAQKIGLRRVVILEHVPEISGRRPTVEEWRAGANDRSAVDAIAADLEEVLEEGGPIEGLEVLRGVEVDADPFALDGSLLLDDFAGVDLISVAAHVFPGGCNFWFDKVMFEEKLAHDIRESWFDWMEKVLAVAPADIWAHPGDLLGAHNLVSRFDEPGVLERFERLFAIAADRKIAFELNELLGRKLADTARSSYAALVRRAREKGVRFCVSSDAHRPNLIGEYTWVPALIREARLGDADIVEPPPRT